MPTTNSDAWQVDGEADMAAVHVYPRGDLMTHDTTGCPCACGPTTEHVPNPDGPDGWLVTHHSLDGRERHEREASR